MRKNYLLSDRGVSLPIVLAVAAIIMANGYYFFAIDHSASTRTSTVKTILREDAEKKRLAANLSDFKVCTDTFKGYSKTALMNKTTRAISQISKGGVVIIKEGTNFTTDTGSPAFNTNLGAGQPQTHRVKALYLVNTKPDQAIPSSDPAVEATRYSLSVEFETRADGADPTKTKQAINTNAGKNQVLINIPLYIEFSGANVVKCYARPDTATDLTGIFQAIASSCQGETASIVNSPNYGCDHKVKTIDCNANAHDYINRVYVDTSTGVNVTAFSCSILSTDCNATAGATQAVALNMTNSALVCAHPEACGAGTAIMRNGTNMACSRTCKSDGLGNEYLFNSYNPATNTLVCYERRYPCAPGTYASTIYPDGHADCSAIPYKNKDCGANAYATDFDTSYGADVLKCSTYYRQRNCSNTDRYTFIRSLASDSTTASCVTYSY